MTLRPHGTRAGRIRRDVALLLLLGLAGCTTQRSTGISGVSSVFGLERLATPPQATGRPASTLFVSLAGLTPAHYLDPAAALPTVTALARSGVAAERVEAVFPATPQSVHASLVTGLTPAEHGVASERLLGEHGVRRERWWHASRLQGPNLWQATAESGAEVAALDWPATAGATIALLLPDISPSRRGETWLAAMYDSATPWLRDLAAARAARDPELAQPGATRDAFLVDAACEILSAPAPPRLVLLRLSGSAAALRTHGLHDEVTRQALLRADAEVGRLVACLERAGRLGTSALVVVGDLSRIPVHTALRPNVALAAAGLLRADAQGGAESWSAIARSNGGSAFVYARDPDAALQARSALLAEAEQTRAYRIVSADEMIQRGADPEAWFGLEANPGWVFQNSTRPPGTIAASERAAGGYLSAGSEPPPGFVAWGLGVRPGVRVPTMRQTDVAPTLARLLGVSLGPRTDGRAVVGALAVPARTRGNPAPVAAGPEEPDAPVASP
jgi:predicted AlkP superfamily pyrophosphatase or phosphodiesterase